MFKAKGSGAHQQHLNTSSDEQPSMSRSSHQLTQKILRITNRAISIIREKSKLRERRARKNEDEETAAK